MLRAGRAGAPQLSLTPEPDDDDPLFGRAARTSNKLSPPTFSWNATAAGCHGRRCTSLASRSARAAVSRSARGCDSRPPWRVHCCSAAVPISAPGCSRSRGENRIDGICKVERIMPGLERFDQGYQHVEAVTFRRVPFRGHQALDVLEDAPIVALRFDGSDVHRVPTLPARLSRRTADGSR
jgi:hypothetical protein